MRIVFEEDPAAGVEPVWAGLHAFNEAHVGAYSVLSATFTARDGDGVVQGGIAGRITGGANFGWLAIDILWVSEEARGQGVGSRLVVALEERAREKGAWRAYVDTLGFQAEPFYAKHGYVEESRIRDFAQGHDRIYMVKRKL